MLIGLFFFIRASVKDRTEQVQLLAEETEDSIWQKLRQYFDQRAYQVKDFEAQQGRLTLEGFVRPSWFLAIFLTILAACGLLCLSLVLSFLFPEQDKLFLLLILLAPGAGFFYWRNAGRLERVALQVDSLPATSNPPQSRVIVTGHRDELIALQRALPWQKVIS